MTIAETFSFTDEGLLVVAQPAIMKEINNPKKTFSSFLSKKFQKTKLNYHDIKRFFLLSSKPFEFKNNLYLKNILTMNPKKSRLFNILCLFPTLYNLIDFIDFPDADDCAMFINNVKFKLNMIPDLYLIYAIFGLLIFAVGWFIRFEIKFRRLLGG